MAYNYRDVSLYAGAWFNIFRNNLYIFIWTYIFFNHYNISQIFYANILVLTTIPSGRSTSCVLAFLLTKTKLFTESSWTELNFISFWFIFVWTLLKLIISVWGHGSIWVKEVQFILVWIEFQFSLVQSWKPRFRENT